MASKKAPNPIDIYVGSRVKMRRMMLGMSQEKLGEHLGITFQQIQKYEKGTNRIGASRRQHIATILKTPVGWFFEGAPGTPEEAFAAPQIEVKSAGETQAKILFGELSPRARKAVLALMRALAGEDVE